MQTTTLQYPAKGHEGQVLRNDVSESLVAKEAFNAGRFLVRDTTAGDERSVRPPATTGEVTGKLAAGFSHADIAKTYADPNYAIGDVVSVLRQGRIILRVEDAAALSDDVFVRFTATAPEEAGRVRTDADTADAVARPGLTFITSTATADGLIEVEVNLL